ncbi:MAG: hypothetical protein ACJ75F_07255 [Flavisolibacter sp.]|jgi:hypothetical protein
MQEIRTQDFLFQRIRERLPAASSLADVISELLFISNDSAYRRIRGETPLVLDEARILCDAFSISLDDALHTKNNTISFTFTQMDNVNYSFRQYLQEILTNLKMVASAGSKEIIYLSKDVPIFYNFLFSPLFAFRYFFWMKSIMQHPDFTHLQFSDEFLSPEIESLGKEIVKEYASISSTEIWNTESINSTIAQIEYYREAGYFRSAEQIEKIYSSLHGLLEHIKFQAEAGSKFLPGENVNIKANNYNLFYNRVVLGDNTIMVVANGQKMLYLTYDVLNYMITRDEGFCNDVHSKLENLIRRATIISSGSEKQRNIFFNILQRKIPMRMPAINNNSL